MVNLFEIAARRKFRFPSSKGDLTVEQLFDVPLQSRNGFDLNSVAKSCSAAVKAAGEENFVGTQTPGQEELVQKLDLVKHVIKVKLDETAAAETALARRQQARKLEDLLGRKEDQALETLTPDEIKAQLALLRT